MSISEIGPMLRTCMLMSTAKGGPGLWKILIKELDYLIVLVPLDGETLGLVNERVFSGMKRTAYLINVARGGVVDENALITAIDN